MDIDQKTLLIIGASSGIGAAVARLASDQGANVALVARRLDRLERLADELPNSLAIEGDVTDRAQLDAAVEVTLARFGRLDVLINNAGQGLHVPLMDVKAEDYRAILELNLIAALGALQAVAAVMERQGEGAIVNVSSGSALKVPPGVGVYASSKAALDMITAVARLELAPLGIVVSNIHPSSPPPSFTTPSAPGTSKAPTPLTPPSTSPKRSSSRSGPAPPTRTSSPPT